MRKAAAEFDDFVEALKEHRLPGGVFYRVRNAPSMGAANKTMEKVRAYRA